MISSSQRRDGSRRCEVFVDEDAQPRMIWLAEEMWDERIAAHAMDQSWFGEQALSLVCLPDFDRSPGDELVHQRPTAGLWSQEPADVLHVLALPERSADDDGHLG